MTERTCGTCVHWGRGQAADSTAFAEGAATTSNLGACQLEPPIYPRAPTGAVYALFPLTHRERFCGAWEETWDDEPPEPDGDEQDEPQHGEVVPFQRKAA